MREKETCLSEKYS